MKLRIENFGAIKKGEIDLSKKISVFVGYNNTGKTYISQLIWGLNFPTNRIDISGLVSIDSIESFPFSISINSESFSKIIQKKNESLRDDVIPGIFNIERNHFLLKNLKLEFIGNLEAEFLNAEFKYILGSFNIINPKEKTYSYIIFHKKSNSNDIVVDRITSTNDEKSLEDMIKNREFDVLSIHAINKLEVNDFYFALSSLLDAMLFKSQGSPFFLPANRVFYPSYYKYIYSVAKDEKDLIDTKIAKGESLEQIKNLSQRPYTKPVDELIKKIYELNSNTKANDYYSDLLEDLKKLIGGEVEIKKNEGIAPINFSFKLNDNDNLDMYMASSSVNQLTTLYLYFKYWANANNNYLIIDEPEENLHPENQIALVNILMKFVEKNNKILITSHSPLFTDAINNYTNITKLKSLNIDVSKILEDSSTNSFIPENISHDDFGIYFFGNNKIVNYDVENYGIFFKDFFESSEKIKNLSDQLKGEIYNSIDNAEDENSKK